MYLSAFCYESALQNARRRDSHRNGVATRSCDDSVCHRSWRNDLFHSNSFWRRSSRNAFSSSPVNAFRERDKEVTPHAIRTTNQKTIVANKNKDFTECNK
ncbi:hypothetical protein AVEN_176580-1 [Araneus ventricosus]|uniref:Uncharacterized protein n=1 Tax=Araneus ventricosus TaxID=182803 RepID=A0A4Y2TQ16_ARAVE|nr:hypothetical protein AVEN_176580-1 [Araneus ventricosus]